MRFHAGHVLVYRIAFLGEIVVDGAAEARVGDPVRRPRGGWLEAPRYLVLALRAGLEVRKPLLDTVVDALVVAGLEMQAVEICSGTPVTPVQRVVTAEEDGGSDGLLLQQRQLHHDQVRKAHRYRLEKTGAQVVLIAVHCERRRRKAEHDIPELRRHFIAAERAERHAAFAHAAALAQSLLTLVGAEGRYEIVERRIAAIVPMELASLA